MIQKLSKKVKTYLPIQNKVNETADWSQLKMLIDEIAMLKDNQFMIDMYFEIFERFSGKALTNFSIFENMIDNLVLINDFTGELVQKLTQNPSVYAINTALRLCNLDDTLDEDKILIYKKIEELSQNKKADLDTRILAAKIIFNKIGKKVEILPYPSKAIAFYQYLFTKVNPVSLLNKKIDVCIPVSDTEINPDKSAFLNGYFYAFPGNGVEISTDFSNNIQAIWLYNNVFALKTYKGYFPFGLNFLHTPNQIIHKLGKPTAFTKKSLRFDFQDYAIYFELNKDYKIQHIIIMDKDFVME